MGNAQSSRSTSEPMRITKPKTNRSSTNLLLKLPEDAHGPSLAKTPHGAPDTSFDEDATEPPIAGDGKNRKETRQWSRNYIFGVRSHPPQSGEGQIDGLGGIMAGLRDRLSRSGSSNSHGSSTRCSTIMTSCPADSHLPLSLERGLCEPPLPVQVSDDSGPRTEINGPNSTGQALSHLRLCNPDRPDMSTLRRRSMFVPGVATRKNAGKPLPDQPSPVQTRSLSNRDYFSENPSQLEVPLRSMLTALDLAEDGRGSGSPGILRASTPCEVDYSNLGCFKHGTLHITNGAASPVPSTRTTGIKSPLYEEITQTEGCLSVGDGKNASRATSPTGKERNLTGTLNHNRVLPGGDDHRMVTVLSDKPLPNPHSDRFKDSSAPGMDAMGKPSDRNLPAKTNSLQRSPDRSSVIAQEYMSELPSSPFLALNLPSQGNWTLPTFEDEGFVPSPTHSYELSADPEETMVTDPAGSREDALRTLTGAAKDWPAQHRRLTLSSAGSQTTSGLSRSDSQAEDGKPLTKADSGYSSTLSLKSLSEDQPAEVTNQTSSAKARATSSIYTFDVNSSLTQPRVPTKTPPPLPPKVTPFKGPNETGATITQVDLINHPKFTENTPPLPPKPNLSRSQSTLAPIPLAEEVSSSVPPQAPVIELTTESRKSVGDASEVELRRPHRKLHKSPPASRKSVTVQAQSEISEPQIPDVPSEAVARLAGRLRMPSALAHKRSGTLNSNSSTDSSRSSGRLARVSFPRAMDDEAPDTNEKESTKEDRKGSMGLFSRTVRRYKSDSKLNIHPVIEEPEIMPDLDTVLGTLGSGPYDVAMSTLKPTSLRRQSSPDMYPHQVGRMAKTKNTVGMDNKAAALLARQKSKDIAESRNRGLSRPHNPSSSEAGEQKPRPNRLSQRRSLLADAPPVPSVPAVHLLRGSHSSLSVNSLPAELPETTSSGAASAARNQTGTGHRNRTASSSSSHDVHIEAYKRNRRQRRKSASAELLGRYHSTTSSSSSSSAFHCDPIFEHPSQESSAGDVGKSRAARMENKRYSSELLGVHGLDLRDVPISVQA
ncbi:MAG: hypothetical protein M1816_005801 [Peltula sp. TS41687]|nr:MAG: hypothetical protein M1816_005801 [Peltula sp. TS41687]